MSQVYKVRLPDGTTVRPTEWSSTPFYSTVEFGTGNQTPLHAFSYGVGGPVPGSVGPRRSTDMDTNLDGSGSIMPENQELLLFSIMTSFFQRMSNQTNFFNGADIYAPDPPLVSAANLARIQHDVLLKLAIADTKDYADHPVGFFPAAMGVHMTLGAAQSQNNASMHAAFNGGVNCYENRRFATPHRVGPGEAFEIILEFPTGSVSGLDFGADTGARIIARIYADGYRKRPVA